MKAVVVDVNANYVVVLNKKGDFIKIRNNGRYNLGHEIDVANPPASRLTLYQKVASAAAAFACIIGVGLGAYAYSLPYSYVDIDINPSIELVANRFDRVIRAEGLNEDGRELLDSIALKHGKLTDGVREILAKAGEEGYIVPGEENAVMFIVSGEKDTRVEELESTINENAGRELEAMDTEADVLVEKVSLQRREQARELGVSPGRQLLMERYMSARPEVGADEAKAATVREMMKAVIEYNRQQKDTFKAGKNGTGDEAAAEAEEGSGSGKGQEKGSSGSSGSNTGSKGTNGSNNNGNGNGKSSGDNNKEKDAAKGSDKDNGSNKDKENNGNGNSDKDAPGQSNVKVKPSTSQSGSTAGITTSTRPNGNGSSSSQGNGKSVGSGSKQNSGGSSPGVKNGQGGGSPANGSDKDKKEDINKESTGQVKAQADKVRAQSLENSNSVDKRAGKSGNETAAEEAPGKAGDSGNDTAVPDNKQQEAGTAGGKGGQAEAGNTSGNGSTASSDKGSDDGTGSGTGAGGGSNASGGNGGGK